MQSVVAGQAPINSGVEEIPHVKTEAKTKNITRYQVRSLALTEIIQINLAAIYIYTCALATCVGSEEIL